VFQARCHSFRPSQEVEQPVKHRHLFLGWVGSGGSDAVSTAVSTVLENDLLARLNPSSMDAPTMRSNFWTSFASILSCPVRHAATMFEVVASFAEANKL
jgi:hypothetical protein